MGNRFKQAGWQCHNIRASKITDLRKEGLELDQIMRISGHKSYDNVLMYNKVENENVIARLEKLQTEKEENRMTKTGTLRKRDQKGLDKIEGKE